MMVLDRVSNLFQKYRQAEWRTQRQWVGLILLVLVGFILVSVASLGVTSRAALAGREIQDIKALITENEFNNADLKVELARLTSEEVMAPKAEDLGYHAISPGEITYVTVNGLIPQADFRIMQVEKSAAPIVIQPEYTESLIDWLVRQVHPYVGARP